MPGLPQEAQAQPQSTQSTTSTPPPTQTTTTTQRPPTVSTGIAPGKDQFGVEMKYPSLSGGNSWFLPSSGLDARGPFEDKKRSGSLRGGNGVFYYDKSTEVRN